jgi:hypothetical protein
MSELNYAEKAKAIWGAMNPNEKAGVKAGMFPQAVMKAAEGEGYNSTQLAVALMNVSKEQGAETGAAAPSVTLPAEDSPAESAAAEEVKEDEDEAKPDNTPVQNAVTGLPYEWEKCVVRCTMVMLPKEGDAPRTVMLGVRTHEDPWIFMQTTDDQVVMPPAVAALFEQLKAELPARALAAMEREAKKAAEEAKRKKSKFVKSKPDSKPAPSTKPTPATSNSAPASKPTDGGKSQMSLFEF